MTITSALEEDVGSNTVVGLSLPIWESDRLLNELAASSVIRSADWDVLSFEARDELSQLSEEELLDELTQRKLLTRYQASRVLAGTQFGLILGHYRVLDRLGEGGMGIVFKAEHLHLPRLAAIKTIPVRDDEDSKTLQRFRSEMWAVAQMRHPNIVGAIDAGVQEDTNPLSPRLHYFVMDYVPGRSLEEVVTTDGPLPHMLACDIAHQVASALTEANNYNLVHRDIKPSNVMVTPDGKAMLLDFGLVRQVSRRMTIQGTTLGTLDYLAPEQARDASSVDHRADIYSLGATLFRCLTGRTPFQSTGNAVRDLITRLNQSPPSVRSVRPEISKELDEIVARMMAVNPDDRFQTPNSVMMALSPFLANRSVASLRLPSGAIGISAPSIETASAPSPVKKNRVLIVDDEPAIRSLCRLALRKEGIECEEAANGRLGWEALQARTFDLVLTDNDMPEMSGPELLQMIQQTQILPHLKVIMVSGRVGADEMAPMLLAGAHDYVTKPLSLPQLVSRVKAALKLKDAEDRADLLYRRAVGINAELERNLTARDSDLAEARNALVLALAELVSYRDSDPPGSVRRLPLYCRCLAETAANLPCFADQLDPNFIQMLECCAPLRDIGKAGVPDHILMKPGPLEPDERAIMQTHTTIGADTLQKVAREHRFASVFLQVASEIARHHHERYDGTGYPDRLAGNQIPLSARIVAIADIYDALRMRRPYKPPMTHVMTIQAMTQMADGQFDPMLWKSFLLCADDFDRIASDQSI